MSRLVLALTGTDHHPFERMVDWIDAAAVRHRDVRFVVQHGVTRPPMVAEGHGYLSHDRLVDLLAEALVVVCHGGPGIITEARDSGHVPLCVPRDPRLGEHVDGHQQRFARVVGEAGVVRAVTSQTSFDDQLVSALQLAAEPGPGLTTTDLRDAARARVGADLDLLMAAARPLRRSWHRASVRTSTRA